MKRYLSFILMISCLLLQFTGCGLENYKELGEQLVSEICENTGIDVSESDTEPETETETQQEETKDQKAHEKKKQKKKKRKKASAELDVLRPEDTQNKDSQLEDGNTWTDGETVENYAYSTLDDTTKKVYDEVLDAILNHKEKAEVSTLDIDILEKAYDAVCADHGGLFWVSGYVYTQYSLGSKMVSMDFSPQYIMDAKEREKTQKQIDAVVGEFLSGISAADTDYDKVKYVFETLIKNVDYSLSAENNQNIISVFLDRTTVCQGYACATQYLLEKTGIQCTIVKGLANGESHAWNLVRLNGKYYYMDTTWGNSRYRDTSSEMEKYVNYSYMALSSEEISKTHMLDTSFPLPECNSMSHNYFVREGLYFTEWEPGVIGPLLAEVWDAGGGDIALKFSSPALYEKTIEYFVKEQHVADYCENISSIYYLTDEEQYVVIFQL